MAFDRRHLEVPVDNDVTTRLRREFWSRGILSVEQVPVVVRESWQRCMDSGLNPVARRGAEILEQRNIDQTKERNELLIRAAASVLPLLMSQTKNSCTGYLITEASGMIISATGDLEFHTVGRRYGARVGVSWSEGSRGTNGMGTAIATNQPVSVHGGQHFLAANSVFSCAGSPIRDPETAELLGVLDMSTHHSQFQPHYLPMVIRGSGLIEDQILAIRHDRQQLLRLHFGGDRLMDLGEGLIAVDRDLRIVAANATARRQLALPPFGEPGRLFSDVFRTSWRQLVARCHGVLLGCALDLHDGRTAIAWPIGPLKIPASAPPLSQPMVHYNDTLSAESRSAWSSVEHLFVEDAQLAEAWRIARAAGNNRLSITISGESGAGKEVLARAVHAAVRPEGSPFVVLGCAGRRLEDIEYELWDMQRLVIGGAGVGAGKLALAAGGTLFLDNVGELALEHQAQLLSGIESWLEAIGADEGSNDFLLISSTQDDLRAKVSAGQFREDLYQRIGAVGVTLPSLRDRTDLPQLAARLLVWERPTQHIELSAEALARLSDHQWPGNVRELRNVISLGLALLSPGETVLKAEHLKFQHNSGAMTTMPRGGTPGSLATLAESAIRRAVEAHGGNVAAAARELGICRTTIYRKLAAGKKSA